MDDIVHTTLARWRARLTSGVVPQVKGADNGRLTFTGEHPRGMTPFRENVLSRGWEGAHEIEEVADKELTNFIAQIRENPFLLPGGDADGRCGAVVSTTLATMDVRLHEDHHALDAMRMRKADRARDKSHAFLIADESPPANGWISSGTLAGWMGPIFLLDAAVGFFVLRSKLQLHEALISSVSVPAITMTLGAVAGYLTLRPERSSQRRGLGHWVKRIGAGFSISAGFAWTYLVAAYRSCLADGLSATGAEIWRRCQDPVTVIGQAETSFLLMLGVIGLGASIWKTRAYYRGMSPHLRATDEAFRTACANLSAERDAVVAYVLEPAEAGETNITAMHKAAREWATSSANTAELATVVVRDNNRAVDTLNDAVAAVDAEYRQAYDIVRAEEGSAWTDMPKIGRHLDVPAAFAAATRTAVQTLNGWAETVKRSLFELAGAKSDVIAFIDRIAGFTPTELPPLGRGGGHALTWRRRS